MSILNDIVKKKQEELLELKKKSAQFSLLSKREANFFWRNIFKDPVNIIAEVKKASPSAGILKNEIQPAEIALMYEKNGANAVSVVTDREFFKGSMDFLMEVRKAVRLPILRKDFTIHELQIEEACYYQADAILLIAAILSVEEIKRFITCAEKLGLDYILEIHDEDDLGKALKTQAPVLGINNRDLGTFKLDLNTSVRLAQKIPSERKLISESGIETKADAEFLLKNQFNTFLIGSYFMKSENPAEKLIELKSLRG